MKYEKLKDKIIDIIGAKPRFEEPCDYKNMWASTSGYMALFVPHEHIGEAGNTKLNYKSVLAGLPKVNSPIAYSIEQLKLALSKIESYPQEIETFKECDECKGEGEVECKCCGHIDDCEKCSGNGQILIKKEKTGLIEYETKSKVEINYARFDPNLIYKACLLMELLGLEKSILLLTHGSVDKGNLFDFSDCKLLLMPMLPNSEDKLIHV